MWEGGRRGSEASTAAHRERVIFVRTQGNAAPYFSAPLRHIVPLLPLPPPHTSAMPSTPT